MQTKKREGRGGMRHRKGVRRRPGEGILRRGFQKPPQACNQRPKDKCPSQCHRWARDLMSWEVR